MRAQHGAAPMTWSNQLQAVAQAWANTCSDSHSGTSYGENIAWGGGVDCSVAVQMWLSEEPLYQPGGGFQSDAAHYTQVGGALPPCLPWHGGARCGAKAATAARRDALSPAACPTQIVWKSTSQVGCAWASCGGSGFVVW